MKETKYLTRETRAPIRPVDQLVLEGDFLYRPCGAKIDTHTLITGNSTNVNIMPVVTNIMRASGLFHGGLITVNKAVDPSDGKIVAVRYNGDLIIRHLKRKDGAWYLIADDPRVPPIKITRGDTVERIGTVGWKLIPPI